VETQEQALLVQSDGCTDIQGYLIGRPIPRYEVVAMLTEFHNNMKPEWFNSVTEPLYQLIY
jgi:EAL domain-containing protein (putative c-di-GMP-specific phosphodiesterase class I)